MSIRIAASCCQPLQLRSLPRGAWIILFPLITFRPRYQSHCGESLQQHARYHSQVTDPALGAPRICEQWQKRVRRPCHFSTARSEEHTSELQSRRDLVCRLLLEKKKK